MASVAIIIPTLVGGSRLLACLAALERQTLSDFEVVVVDNGGTAGLLDDVFGISLRTITPLTNIGFGASINLGVMATQSPFVVALNDDTLPDEIWLYELISEIVRYPRAGMCASCIRMIQTGRLDSAGMLICSDGSSKQRGGGMASEAFPLAEDILLPSACAALYRREMLEEIGGFDEDFFLYCEDTDLGLRAVWAGWQCRYAPRATIGHHYSGTAGAASRTKASFVERNRLWVAIKNFPFPMLAAVPLFAMARYLMQCVAALTGRGTTHQFFREGNSIFHALDVVIRAHLETLKNLPQLMRKRAAIRGTRKIPRAEFIARLNRHRIGLKGLARS